MSKQLRILFSPLNWGLGHASRLVPVIRQAVNDGHEVFLAANSPADKLWLQYFPHLQRIENLPAYPFQFPNHRYWQWSMMRQTPVLSHTIHLEHRWLAASVRQYGITHTVSDNRYGLWHPKCKNILLTHQPYPLAGTPWHFAGMMVARKLMRHFNEIWIPDYAGENNLSGALSHRVNNDSRFRYIGPLSALYSNYFQPKKNQTLVLLSGPEPWRSRLLEEALHEIKNENTPVMIAGAAADAPTKPLPFHATYQPLMIGDALSRCILESSKIIARCGYSTMMDLHLLGVREVVWKPTPGQIEQEYLFRWMKKNNAPKPAMMTVPSIE
jgi:hypothetical protein